MRRFRFVSLRSLLQLCLITATGLVVVVVYSIWNRQENGIAEPEQLTYSSIVNTGHINKDRTRGADLEQQSSKRIQEEVTNTLEQTKDKATSPPEGGNTNHGLTVPVGRANHGLTVPVGRANHGLTVPVGRATVKQIRGGNTNHGLTVPVGRATVKQNVDLVIEPSTKATKDVDVKFILLMSYMRSGSTVTSELLKQSEDTFFFFEPFWGVYGDKHRRPKVVCTQEGHQTCTAPTDFFETEHGTHVILNDLFNCRFRNLPVGVLASFNYFYPNTAYNISTECFPSRQRYKIRLMYRSILRSRMVPNCITRLEELCRSKPVRLIKAIRLPMTFTENFLRHIPNLKIIYLVRDPRAVIHSRQSIHYVSIGEPPIKLLCDSMEEDMSQAKRLLQLYKSRFYIIFYECFALVPFRMVHSIFEFLGLKYTRQALDWLQTHMNSEKLHKEEFMKFGKSIEISQSWRKTISVEVLNVTDKNCGRVYEYLDLTSFPDFKDVRNLKISNLRRPMTCFATNRYGGFLNFKMAMRK